MLWIPRDFEAEEMRYLGYILWSDREQAEMKYDKKKFYHHIQACFQQYGGAYDKGSKLSIKQLKKICDIIHEGEEDERN